MQECSTEISKEVYDRALANNNRITKEDESKIFSESIIWGYGLYGTRVYKEGEKYMCQFKIGSSCD